jgi:hypothetical protein
MHRLTVVEIRRRSPDGWMGRWQAPVLRDRSPAWLVAAGIAGARVLLGVVALCRPNLPARMWVADDDARRRAVQLLARALGGRDLALGLGALVALAGCGPAAPWVAAGGLADAGDVAATVAAWRHLPPSRRRLVTLIAGGALAGAVLAAPFVDRPHADRPLGDHRFAGRSFAGRSFAGRDAMAGPAGRR